MELTPDAIVYLRWGFVTINATIVFTWLTMVAMVGGALAVTRALETGPPESKLQLLVEITVLQIRKQIREATPDDPDRYLPFVGTLFLFIAVSTLLSVLPGVQAPVASLSTAGALALCVFCAVPAYGIAAQGMRAYLRHYLSPSPLMLPFHLIGEISRTVALAVRLFGNLMSGRLIVAILLSIAPILFPALMEAFGLLIGLIQAYVFAILALVYIASATRTAAGPEEEVAEAGEA